MCSSVFGEGFTERHCMQDLLHTGGISMQGLADLLSKAAPGEASISTVRHRLMEENRDLFDKLHKTLRVPLVDGGEMAWHVLDLPKAINHSLESSPGLAELYSDALLRSPVSSGRQWSVCLAFDEFCPGNKLQV